MFLMIVEEKGLYFVIMVKDMMCIEGLNCEMLCWLVVWMVVLEVMMLLLEEDRLIGFVRESLRW